MTCKQHAALTTSKVARMHLRDKLPFKPFRISTNSNDVCFKTGCFKPHRKPLQFTVTQQTSGGNNKLLQIHHIGEGIFLHRCDVVTTQVQPPQSVQSHKCFLCDGLQVVRC